MALTSATQRISAIKGNVQRAYKTTWEYLLRVNQLKQELTDELDSLSEMECEVVEIEATQAREQKELDQKYARISDGFQARLEAQLQLVGMKYQEINEIENLRRGEAKEGNADIKSENEEPTVEATLNTDVEPKDEEEEKSRTKHSTREATKFFITMMKRGMTK
ncbi:hypothetical protein HDU98_000624 [Podochytrium sp. JEL0797]|nr:hypothetical protein HDU98_000624 [Podochytrium sp. JEL0797]